MPTGDAATGVVTLPARAAVGQPPDRGMHFVPRGHGTLRACAQHGDHEVFESLLARGGRLGAPALAVSGLQRVEEHVRAEGDLALAHRVGGVSRRRTSQQRGPRALRVILRG